MKPYYILIILLILLGSCILSPYTIVQIGKAQINKTKSVSPTCPTPKDITYDKNKNNADLDDPHINPEMKLHLDEALRKISANGGIKVKMKDGTEITATPELHEAYRPPERAEKLHEDYVKGVGSKAQDAGKTSHEYGLAVDIWLRDQKGNLIDDKSKIYGSGSDRTYPGTWYIFSKKLAGYMIDEGFEWADKPSAGGPIGDSPHFEYHPNWQGLRGAETLPGLRDTAKKESAQDGSPDNWLQRMWKDAGAPCTSSGTDGSCDSLGPEAKAACEAKKVEGLIKFPE